MVPVQLPRLYAILDGDTVRAAGLDLLDAARSLRDAGVQFLQYREKKSNHLEIFQNAQAISTIFRGSGALLVVNDWSEIAVEAGWDGVHVGQRDASVEKARQSVGQHRLVGVSTHTVAQFRAAILTDADYIAYGPVFSTVTKLDAEAVVGLEGLRQVRTLSQRPLIAIGGISDARMPSVFAAGADSIAVIGALFSEEQSLQTRAASLLRSTQLPS